VEAVSATLTNIYLLEEIERLQMTPDLFALAWLVGVTGALLGSLAPALETSRRDSRALLAPVFLQRDAQRWAPRLAFGAVAALVLAAAWFVAWGHAVRIGGFVLGFVLLVAAPLTAPQALRFACDRIRVRGWGLAYSLRSLSLRLASSSFAVGGLAVAVSMMLGITLLIGSFQRTLETWIETSVRADIYVATESWTRAGEQAGLDPALVQRLREHPAVAKTETLRQIQVQTGERRIRLAGIGLGLEDGEYEMPLRTGDPATILRELRAGDTAVVSEPLARKQGLGVGDTLRVTGPEGEIALRITGVSYDYSSENGAALVSADTMQRHFGTKPVNTVALGLVPGADPERVVGELKEHFAGEPLLFHSNRALRAQIQEIFDQTFAITRILQLLALLIAVTGIALALLVRARERRGELALYRAVGAHRRQIFREFVGEGLGIGLFGVAFGVVGGIGLAMILVHIINPTYFGWTIRTAWPWAALGQQIGTILLAAVVASLYPALRAAQAPARELGAESV
jgi:putative ABC transport system permease protein